ncbi:MAG: pyruvate carboxylase subunit B [Candidatus Heimdallarchaeota archaeon]
MSREIQISDLSLRDAHQSLLATRLRLRDMIPILETIDEIGYFSLEMWGGATYDSCLRYLREDPWERLRTVKKHVKKTPLQMLLRGQNIVGYRHYPDDIVEKFVSRAVQSGIDIFRIFDALNDPRNLEFASKIAKKEGAHVQGCVCYTISPVHTVEHYVDVARKIQDEMNADSLCLKDMAGMLSPGWARRIVKGWIDGGISIPIHIHSHYTSGMATASHLAAIEAGANIIDTAISSFAGGSSHSPAETLATILEDLGYRVNLDFDRMKEMADYFRMIRKKYSPYESEFTGVDANVLRYQVPGGMISNLVSQLAEQNALDRLSDVLDEVPRVRKELGYPPLVTPTSQIVGTQAVMHIIMGERYSIIPKEVQNLVKGLYGQLAAPVSSDIAKKVLRGEKPITCRPADLLEPEWDQKKSETKEIIGREPTDEEVLSYSLFPNVTIAFFQRSTDGATKEIATAIASALAVEHGFITNNDFSRVLGMSPSAAFKERPWRRAGREMMMNRSHQVTYRRRD